MPFGGGDFGFVGQSYQAAVVLQNAEDSINWFLEHDPTENPKMPNALLACPGLAAMVNTQLGQVRGLWVLPGGNQALAAVANAVWLITIQNPATASLPPVLASTYVGALNTSTGPVVMRDVGVLQNGLGGYCLIVDGSTSGYYYLFSGAVYTMTFAAATQSGSNVLTLPGSLPNGLIITSGGALQSHFGAIPAATKITSVNINALTVTMSSLATSTNGTDTITLTVPVFGQITDPGFLGADRIAFIEGWLILNLPGTRTFYTNGPTPYSMIFPGSFYALKDSSTDNLITLVEQNRELWLFGERTSEVWFNAGLANFAFSRIPGVGPQVGCAAKHSITRCGQQLVWLAKKEQGQNIIACTEQYSWKRLSTHAVEHAISGYPVISDAIGYGYEDEGHLFYMLTFPTADVTWCFDFTSGAWHKRLSWDPVAGVYHRHRSNCFMDFGDVRIVGDYLTGQLHQMSRRYFWDNSLPLRCLRRTPHVWNKESRERAFFSQLQVEFIPGVGAQSGLGNNPQAMLRWSDDGGFTWSNERWASVGLAGQTKNRCIWRALGQARDRVWEVVFDDPVPKDIVGATLFAEG